MQGATTDDEPMGRNPGTSEAANLTALKVRGCDLAPRFADLIEASGHVPCFKAVHMNAPSARVKSIEKPLAPRAVPHMRFCGVVAAGAKRARAEIRVPSMAGQMDEKRWRLTSIVLETAGARPAAARIITR